ncbi:acyltransferase [Olivibacter ginsenosidimutans]|uniref:Acyltransferase n=1 Tax=Olivibacter ginsenosidimutans TaxID=1176537 RepID=A0ABP9BT70_9SPHI
MSYWTKLTDAKGEHLSGLDHLRALAIILVFLCHYRAYEMPTWVDTVGRFGWVGVDLFFVLSGFLIGEQLLRQVQSVGQINFKRFYISRTFRILPAYFFMVFLYFAFPFLREREGIAPFWQFATFTQNFDLDFGDEGAFSHAWSLSIEEQFYWLLPLTISLSSGKDHFKKGFYTLLGVFLLGLLLRGMSWVYFVSPFYAQNITEGRFVVYNKWVYYPTYNRLDGLLVGVTIAAIITFAKPLTRRLSAYGNALFFSGMALMALAYVFLKDDRLAFWPTLLGYPLLALAFGCMVFGAIFPSCFLYHIRWKFSTIIATLSYSIYLCHKVINELLQKPLDTLGIPAQSNWRVFSCACCSILAALLMNRLIEYPFLKWRSVLLSEQNKQH